MKFLKNTLYILLATLLFSCSGSNDKADAVILYEDVLVENIVSTEDITFEDDANSEDNSMDESIDANLDSIINESLNFVKDSLIQNLDSASSIFDSIPSQTIVSQDSIEQEIIVEDTILTDIVVDSVVLKESDVAILDDLIENAINKEISSLDSLAVRDSVEVDEGIDYEEVMGAMSEFTDAFVEEIAWSEVFDIIGDIFSGTTAAPSWEGSVGAITSFTSDMSAIMEDDEIDMQATVRIVISLLKLISKFSWVIFLFV